MPVEVRPVGGVRPCNENPPINSLRTDTIAAHATMPSQLPGGEQCAVSKNPNGGTDWQSCQCRHSGKVREFTFDLGSPRCVA